jgi:hypothetical protein
MLSNQLKALKTAQILELHDVLVTACTAAELDGDWREVFRRAKNRKVGRMRRIYELLYNADKADIHRAAQHLVDHLL